MKRFKKIFILLGVLVIACIATIIVTRTEQKKEQIKNADEIILSVTADSVDSLSWEYDDTALSFHKEDAWLWDEDADFPVDGEKTAKLLSDFEEFGAAFIIEDVEDFGQYGLEKPTCTIRFSANGQEYTVLLGAFSTMDSQRYVSIGDGNVYLVKHDPFDNFKLELKDMILHDDTPHFDKITKVTFGGTENYSLSREEGGALSYCANDLYFTQNDAKSLPLDTYRVENYCATISTLNLKNFVSYNVTADELAEWGLDTPEMTVQMDYTVTDGEDSESAESFTLNIGRNQEELAAKEAAEAEDEEYSGTVTAYARVGESQIVYQISESDYNALIAASYNDLRHNEVLTADFDSIKQIDIALEGETYSVSAEKSENDEEDEITYFCNGEEIEITSLRSKMTDLTVSDFVSEQPTEKEEISLIFHLDNDNFPLVRAEFYRYDGTNCLAVLDGETLGLVSRSSVVALIEAINTIVLG